MFIRVNKTTNEIDNSLIASNLVFYTDIVLEEGWEWIDTADSWYVNYEMNKILPSLKQQKINEFSQMAFDMRELIYPTFEPHVY